MLHGTPMIYPGVQIVWNTVDESEKVLSSYLFLDPIPTNVLSPHLQRSLRLSKILGLGDPKLKSQLAEMSLICLKLSSLNLLKTITRLQKTEFESINIFDFLEKFAELIEIMQRLKAILHKY